jgi:hypothetical protein
MEKGSMPTFLVIVDANSAKPYMREATEREAQKISEIEKSSR